jgi:hypothetical protein
MGTGVGEAMLIGAAVGATAGGAGAAIQGGDPLKGALMVGATGCRWWRSRSWFWCG